MPIFYVKIPYINEKNKSKIKIGWAEEKLSFSKPVSLVGQFAERISEYEEKPLTVTAFAVESEDDNMIICSTDLVGVTYPLLLEIKKGFLK